MRIALAVICALTVQSLHAVDSWAFDPDQDTFSPEAAVDLRMLNEHVAGEKGFVRLSADGNAFVLGDGTPARFWAINSGCEKAGDMARQARFLAKRGVNLVRLAALVQPDLKKHPDARMDDINRDALDNAWRWVAALKAEGIYSLIVPYWAFSTPIPKSWGIIGHKSQTGVLFCDKTYQDGYKTWLRAIYSEKNPYTGVPLAQEPAVAIIEIQNEDSLLFWTFDHFLADRGQPYDELRSAFGDFANRKYGSVGKALAAWAGASVDGDEAGNGRLGFEKTWDLLHPPAGGGWSSRSADQVEFVAREMREFNVGIERYLRQELGCKQLINACNWKTADNVALNDSERWSYTGNEVMAVNRYFSSYHVGANDGWAIEPHSHYLNNSITLDPTALTLNVKRVVGHPFIITETCWTSPNLYQAEGPLMGAAYSSLTGLDVVFWNGTNSHTWDEPMVPWGKMFKWLFATPTTIGQFPAAAWIYRKGYAQLGKTVVHEERALDDLWRRRTPLIAEESGYDPNRDVGLPANSAVKTTVDPLAYLVGRVEVVYDGDPAKSRVVDLEKYIDKDKKTVVSTSGEERIDYGAGLFTLDAPKAQGAAGFLGKAGPVALHDVTITCANSYAAITVVALDDLPLGTSRKILVQIGTTNRPTDWQEHEEDFKDPKSKNSMHGFAIDSIGKNPWQVECASGTVTIRNPMLASATVLDANLMRAKPAVGSQVAGAFSLSLAPDALYVLVEGK